MASGTRVHRKIQEASLGREEHKISGRKTNNRSRAKRSRRSSEEVSLDNPDVLIDGATEATQKGPFRKYGTGLLLQRICYAPAFSSFFSSSVSSGFAAFSFFSFFLSFEPSSSRMARFAPSPNRTPAWMIRA